MKILKFIILWFLGLLCGIILMILYRNSNPPLAKVTIKNESSSILSKVVITEDRHNTNYLIENIEPNSSKKAFLYIAGEGGYNLVVRFDDTKELIDGSYYTESGYSDLFIVTNDSIIYKPGPY